MVTFSYMVPHRGSLYVSIYGMVTVTIRVLYMVTVYDILVLYMVTVTIRVVLW